MTSTQRRIQEAAMRIFAERGVTQIAVSDLAEAAGVARGTIYNNLGNTDALFDEVASQLADEMHDRVRVALNGVDDPAPRLSDGLRLFVRRAHEEPVWGRFIIRFAFNSQLLRDVFSGPPGVDLGRGIERGRYRITREMAVSALSMLSGCTVSAMLLVLDGHKTWRDAGSEVAELMLRALGLPQREAQRIARSELPDLPQAP